MELALFVFAVLLVAMAVVALGGYAVGFSRGESHLSAQAGLPAQAGATELAASQE